MDELKFYLLGPFRATLVGQPVQGFAYDKVRALLAYLVVESHTPHSREKLAALLWPEADPNSARTNLRKALSTLRKALCDDNAPQPCLMIERDTVQINPKSNFWLDVDQIKNHLDATLNHTHLQFESCETCVCDIEEAAALYGGEFLQGLMINSLEFEEWSLTIRENLHTRMLTALHELTQYYLNRGEYGLAQKHALRQVELEPYREEAHRALMQSLARNGERSAALAQYERCRHILAEELGVEPSRETQALYERIRAAGEARPHNLPSPNQPLIGREAGLQQIARHLANPMCRLLTLVGMGGIGKTSLALQAALEHSGFFLQGVFFVSLAALDSTEAIVPAIAEALDFRFVGPRPLDAQLLDFIAEKELLLILDNFEHLANGAELVNKLLDGAPYLKMLITSRERLRLRTEWIIQIDGLAYPQGKPSQIDDLEKYSSVQCFNVIAQRLSPSLMDSSENREAVVRICQLTGGVPLGIELAASWVDQFSPTQIADEIEHNLDTLATSMRDVPPRQRSMRATFDYSWALLLPEELNVFQQLTVFQGGFDETAARRVASATSKILAALVDKNLIRSPGNDRYAIHSLLNQFANEKLAAHPETETATRDRHCEFYLAFLAEKSAQYRRVKQSEFFDDLESEYGNFLAAWRHAIQERHWREVDLALEGIFLFFEVSSRFREGQEALERAVSGLQEDSQSTDDRLRTLGRVLTRLGRFYIYLGQNDKAEEVLSESRTVLKDFPTVMEYASALGYLGIIYHFRGQFQQAEEYAHESLQLSQESKNQDGEAFSLNLLGNLAQAQGEYAQAMDFYQRNLEIREKTNDVYGIAIACNNLGNLAHAQKRLVDARRLYERSYTSFEQINHAMGMAAGLSNAGYVATKLGEFDRAREMLERSLQIKRDLGQQLGVANTLTNLGELACETGDLADAAAYFHDALKIALRMKVTPLAVELLVCFATLFIRQGKFEQAVELLAQADAHPAGKHETKTRALQLLEELQNQLPSKLFAAALERGKAIEFDALVRKL